MFIAIPFTTYESLTVYLFVWLLLDFFSPSIGVLELYCFEHPITSLLVHSCITFVGYIPRMELVGHRAHVCYCKYSKAVFQSDHINISSCQQQGRSFSCSTSLRLKKKKLNSSGTCVVVSYRG